MMFRNEDVVQLCTSRADLKNALEDIVYNGYAIWTQDEYQLIGTSVRCKFVFEYKDADKNPVKLEFINLWVRTYSNTVYIDGKAYDIDLLLNEFGGVWFSILFD